MSTASSRTPAVSRPLLITLGVLVALAVAYLAFTLLTGGGDDGAVDPSLAVGSEPDVAGSTAPTPSEAGSEAPSEVAQVEPTFEVFDARDPFDELVSDDTGGGGDTATVGDTAATSATVPGTTAPDPASSTPPAPAGTTDPASATPGGDQSQTTVGGTTIMLEDVYSSGGEDVAVVVVDAEGYEAREGETVAGKVEVLDIAGSCATMRYDDNRFILCEGEQIRK